MFKRVLSLIVALMLVLSLGAVAEIQSTDMLGRQHTLAEPAGRVAALSAAECEILFALGAAIAGIGQAVGRENEAQALVDGMRASFDAVIAKVPENAAPSTVYFEVSPLEYGLWTAGKGTFMNELAEMLGLENIFADVDGWAEISQEQVIARNPDLIVTVTMYFGDGPTPAEEISARAGWADVSAVKNGRILTADSNAMTRPGPRLTEAAQDLCDFAYGD